MKRILTNLCILMAIGFSATAQTNNATGFANRIAQKMKDTLLLSEAQKVQVFTINMQLHQQKQTAWQQYGATDSLLTIHEQRIENSRDSLYKTVLTDGQFRAYRDKKRMLVSNN